VTSSEWNVVGKEEITWFGVGNRGTKEKRDRERAASGTGSARAREIGGPGAQGWRALWGTPNKSISKF